MSRIQNRSVHLLLLLLSCLSVTELCQAWLTPALSVGKCNTYVSKRIGNRFSSPVTLHASKHGENACFLPLTQLDQDYYCPRIIQIAGAYPGINREELTSVSSEPSPDPGQWNYEFCDPDGPQVGSLAIEGSITVHFMKDPVLIIGDHFTLGVPLPDELKEPVDLVLVVDRGNNYFSERKFLVMEVPGKEELEIAAFDTKAEIPTGAEILGQVMIVQIPWLPSMKPTKSGFAEIDEYF